MSVMEAFQPAPGKILYGIWNPVKNEDEWNERRWMEWWPSQADMFRSMRQRLCPDDRPDAKEPCEIIDFGPRGGLRRRPYEPGVHRAEHQMIQGD